MVAAAPKVEIYSKDYCPYCVKAKNLLDVKGVDYALYDITRDTAKQQEMLDRAMGRRTVPQIFINGIGIGGFDELSRLDREGKLDAMLAPTPARMSGPSHA